MSRAKWTVIDTKGRRWQPPTPQPRLGNFGCGDIPLVYTTEHIAVLAWAVDRGIDVAEIVPPFQFSIKEQCKNAIDDLWEQVRLMGEAEGGNGTGGTVRFVVDDSGGFDEEVWTADQCDDALEGIRIALSAIDLMDRREDDE